MVFTDADFDRMMAHIFGPQPAPAAVEPVVVVAEPVVVVAEPVVAVAEPVVAVAEPVVAVCLLYTSPSPRDV